MASTPNNKTNENERRKKQTIERTKVNHLSRQLQMRLQYARLKVDHGWQIQKLNEVENLYFHHAHQRGSKSHSLPSLVTTTQNDMSSYMNSRSSPPQSSLSFKIGSSPLSRSHVNPNRATSNQEETTSYVGPFFHPKCLTLVRAPKAILQTLQIFSWTLMARTGILRHHPRFSSQARTCLNS